MSEQSTIITIDGPSGSGKSTISQLLAAKLNFTYLDTGAMYRAVGLKVHREQADEKNSEGLAALMDDMELRFESNGNDIRVLLDGEDISLAIRTAEMSMIASRVSAIPVVREKLTVLQKKMGQQGPVVAEGRDMGTVVFPKARYKFYLDASSEERARRRTEQLHEKGLSAEYADILAQIRKRDHDDSARSLAPLKPADDAVIIDSSQMDINEVLDFMMRIIKA